MKGSDTLTPPSGPGTHLALSEEVGHQRPLYSVLQVTIREDDERRLASKLQGNRFDSFSRHLHDLTEQEQKQREV